MPLVLAPGAFLAGALMFLAPCTLPIVPGYLLFIAGVPAGAAASSSAGRRRRILLNALAFVIGFSLVFITLGVSAAAVGPLIGGSREAISRLAGVVVIIFGLTMLGVLRLPVVSREWHVKVPSFLSLGKWQSSLFVGALFALGWSPCIGPILGTVLLIASQSPTASQGALLLGIFSLGLAVPFMLTALLIDTAANYFARWGRALGALSTIGGILLIVLGVLIVLGSMGSITAWCYSLFERLGFSALYSHL